MKAFWKVLGFAALAAGLTPYKMEKNEETGENSYQALLWRATSVPGQDGTKKEININLSEGTLTSKLMDAIEKKDEAHLFSDELSVEYNAGDADEAAVGAADDAVAATDDAAETEEKAAEEPAEAAPVVEEASGETAEAGE